MNDHAGWDKFGRCVFCLSKDPISKCLDPSSDEFRARIMNLEQELCQAKDDRDWWMKKHKQDCLSMRIIGRKEGAHEMKQKIRELVWQARFDEFLDSEIASLEYKEDHFLDYNYAALEIKKQ